MKKYKTAFEASILLTFAMVSAFALAHYNPQASKVGSVASQKNYILPDPIKTPGVTNPDITEANYKDTICNPAWSTKSIRPSTSYTGPLKLQQIAEYGYVDTASKDYELDHLISLELGGNPKDPKNLWPESYNTTPNAHDKDKVENFLHKEVCSGIISLTEAQKEVSTNWVAVLDKMNGSVGAVDDLGQSDSDDEQ